MAINDRLPKVAAGLLILVLLSGCASSYKGLNGEEDLADSRERSDRNALLGQMPWVPLSLSRESFITAERRIKSVKVGMPRAGFLDTMKLTPLGEGDNQVVLGDGWITDASSRNTVGGSEVEEYVFGYMEGYRLKERFAVIIEKGRVARIVRSAWPQSHNPPTPPAALTSSPNTLNEENRLIGDFYRSQLQDQEAFERVIPYLRRVRAGWTSAELRLALGGSLYRLSHGYVYFQEGLLWDQGFSEQSNGSAPIVILPFGYRTPDGTVHTRVIVRAEGGVVTAVFWHDRPAQGASVPPRAERAPAGK